MKLTNNLIHVLDIAVEQMAADEKMFSEIEAMEKDIRKARDYKDALVRLEKYVDVPKLISTYAKEELARLSR